MKDSKCNDCEKLHRKIKWLSKSNDKLSYSSISEKLKTECCENYCADKIKGKNISAEFIQFMISKNNTEDEPIFYDNDFVYNTEYWREKNIRNNLKN